MNHSSSFLSWADHFISYLKYLRYRLKKESLYHKRFMMLQKIMRNQLLDTFFQPIVCLQSGTTIGYEALNRPAPSKWFPSTESFYDFVGQTDQVFLFDYFCRNISLQRFIELSEHLEAREDTLLFMNIHPHVLLDSSYHSGETLGLLQDLGIDPGNIVLELTERSAVTDFVQFEQVLSNYRSQGFRIAVDDMGAGYNSLKTLVHLKPEFIKLDKSLTQNIDQNNSQQQMVTLIIEFSKKTMTHVIAEGIERVEDLSYLSNKEVDFGQGYALGKPKKEVMPGKVPDFFQKRKIL